MTTDFWVGVLVAVAATLLLPFALMLIAKLVSYGWASGRHRFEQDRKKRDSHGSRPS